MSASTPQRRSQRIKTKPSQLDEKQRQTRSSRRIPKPTIIESLSETENDDEENIEGPITKSPLKKKSPFKTSPETPSKQRKLSNDENATPPKTPTVLLEKLSLTSPEVKSNRKQLFKETNLYQSARKALHSACPTNLPGREKELGELRDFIVKHVEEGSSGTLYVSGPPGTGKTASLSLILQEEQVATRIKEVYVNCTGIKSSGAIFARIAKELELKAVKSERECVSAVENYLRKCRKSTLLVLDEIDQLESKKQSVLYTIFEWPSAPSSKLILIGIANALDLTDRILPRLQARCELKPRLMHFAPYTKAQIVDILTNRLKSAGVLNVFSPVAVQMLAGKVAAVSGDVRRALDIGRRVVELVDKKRPSLKSLENLAEELSTEEGAAAAKVTQTVDLTQVIGVLNNVYGGGQNLGEDVDESFPLLQKIVVCCLLLILKKAKNKDVTVGRLHEVCRRVCAKRNIQVVDQGEFVGICALIETRGIIKIIRKKDPRLNKVSLMWDEEEVAHALRDKQLMSTILQDDSCLGKL